MGPFWSIRIWGTGFADSWGLEGVGLKIERWVSVGRKASLAGSGGWGRVENSLDRWLAAAWEIPEHPSRRGSQPFIPTPTSSFVSLSPSQTLLCLLKEMAPTFKDTGAAVW